MTKHKLPLSAAGPGGMRATTAGLECSGEKWAACRAFLVRDSGLAVTSGAHLTIKETKVRAQIYSAMPKKQGEIQKPFADCKSK